MFGTMASFKAFWDWFSEYSETFYGLPELSMDMQAFYFDALCSQLEAFGSTVSFVFRFATSGERSELTLTTNGQADGVLVVQNLVDLAPDIPKWRIVAFIQPTMDIELLKQRTDPAYHFKELSLKASDIVWLPDSYDPDTDKHVLVFGFRNLASALQALPIEKVDEYVHAIVLDLLGEKVVCKSIETAYYDLMKPNDEDWWFLLEALPDYLEGGW